MKVRNEMIFFPKAGHGENRHTCSVSSLTSTLLPGCLVLAPVEEDGVVCYWPAIIEFSPAEPYDFRKCEFNPDGSCRTVC